MATKHTDEKRAEKLKQILEKLEAGEHVQNRTLETWLTDDEFQSMKDCWNDQLDIRKELNDKPDEIIEFEKRLKKAIFSYNKYDYYSRAGNRSAVKNAKNKTDSLFESLLEFLQEILDSDPSIAEWFDRPISFEHGEEPSLSPAGFPRTITSRSLDRQQSHFRKMTKQDTKVEAVSNAINSIENKLNNPVNTNILKQKLKNLKK